MVAVPADCRVARMQTRHERATGGRANRATRIKTCGRGSKAKDQSPRYWLKLDHGTNFGEIPPLRPTNLVSLAFKGVQGNLNRKCLPIRKANTEPKNHNALQELPRPSPLVVRAAAV